jgi:opacity protein-like surface antigen
VGEVKVTSMFGLYAKPQFKSGGFKAYGLLGYAGYNTETTIEFGNYSESEKTADDGISYGLGAGFDFGQHGLALEWKSTKIDGGDISGVAVFYQYQF